MTTNTIDHLFLELSQFTQATTAKELRLQQEVADLMGVAEYAWTIIANASGGDWSKETSDWQQAAAKWRDENYYPALAKHAPKEDQP